MAPREVGLETYVHFADRDALSRVVLERMLAGVSTRRYLMSRSVGYCDFATLAVAIERERTTALRPSTRLRPRRALRSPPA
jgi:hypothetical protein